MTPSYRVWSHALYGVYKHSVAFNVNHLTVDNDETRSVGDWVKSTAVSNLIYSLYNMIQ
jgi:hypothetical protein